MAPSGCGISATGASSCPAGIIRAAWRLTRSAGSPWETSSAHRPYNPRKTVRRKNLSDSNQQGRMANHNLTRAATRAARRRRDERGHLHIHAAARDAALERIRRRPVHACNDRRRIALAAPDRGRAGHRFLRRRGAFRTCCCKSCVRRTDDQPHELQTSRRRAPVSPPSIFATWVPHARWFVNSRRFVASIPGEGR